MPPMFCTKCGKELKNGAAFCIYCGTPVKSSADHKPIEKEPAAVNRPVNRQADIIQERREGQQNNRIIQVTILAVGIFLVACISLGAFFFLRSRDGDAADVDLNDVITNDADTVGNPDAALQDDESWMEEQENLAGTDVEETVVTGETSGSADVSDDGEVSPDETAQEAAAEEDDAYILPGSDSQYITAADLKGFSAEECRLARNEIYARHGRKFDDEALQAYFDSKEWYHGTIDPDDFREDMLNDYELANRDVIVAYEKQAGYR